MNSVVSDAVMIGLDWGTSSLRAYLIGNEGAVLDSIATDKGIMRVKDGAFEETLHDMLDGWLKQKQLPVVASGMITSRNGWVETPYISCPGDRSDLAKALVSHKTTNGTDLFFVTGMSTEHDGAPDVMRGEETQIIGAAVMGMGDGTYVMPGTHSKWLVVQNAKIDDYKTYMTGEFFSVVKQHTILGALMQGGDFSEEGFRRGVREGLASGADLLHNLFHVRTMPLFDKISEDMVADYLSGMLIGAEIASGIEMTADDKVTIVGRGDLADRYERALSIAGLDSERAHEHICARGLYEIARTAGLL